MLLHSKHLGYPGFTYVTGAFSRKYLRKKGRSETNCQLSYQYSVKLCLITESFSTDGRSRCLSKRPPSHDLVTHCYCNSRCARLFILQKPGLLGENIDEGSDGEEDRLSASGSDEEEDEEDGEGQSDKKSTVCRVRGESPNSKKVSIV